MNLNIMRTHEYFCVMGSIETGAVRTWTDTAKLDGHQLGKYSLMLCLFVCLLLLVVFFFCFFGGVGGGGLGGGVGEGGSVDGMLEEYKIYFVFHIMAYCVKLVTTFLCVILDLTISI